MESGLLKIFHDSEHFDSYQMQFDDHSDIWGSDRDTLHMNLSHTLEGILPSSPSHHPTTDFDCDIENKNFLAGTHISILHQNQIKLEYDSEEDEFENRKISITSIESDEFLRCITPAVEIIPIDPDCEYSSPLSHENNDEDESTDDEDDNYAEMQSNSEEEEGVSNEKINEDPHDEYGVGDEKNVISDNFNNSGVSDIPLDFSELNSFDKFVSPIKNNITIKSHKMYNDLSKDERFLDDYKLDSDILDVKNFDLTKYITEEDCKLPPPTPGRSIKIEKYSPVKKTRVQTPKRGYKRLTREFMDSDSDESIDVETVSERSFNSNKTIKTETEDVIETKLVVKNDDDFNSDPTWTPTKLTNNIPSKSKPSSNIRQKTRITLPSPNLLNPPIRTRILNAGTQLYRNKLISVVVHNDKKIKNMSDHDYCSPTKKSHPLKKAIEIEAFNPLHDRKRQRVGLGRGKNLSLTSNTHELVKSEDENVVKAQEVIEKTQIEKTQLENEITSSVVVEEFSTPVEIPVKEKRKLNLQEYKLRRENPNLTLPLLNDPVKIEDKKYSDSKLKEILTVVKNENSGASIIKKSTNIQTPDSIKKPVSLLIAKDHEIYTRSKVFDPILEATKKALRLKRAKLSEPKIVIPVSSISCLLPLAEMTNMNCKSENINDRSISPSHMNPNYEEIVIVSIGCNTNITLPPNFDMNISSKMLKNSSLLSNINDTINKVKLSGENVQISANSLLSSITNVVLKKTSDNTQANLIKTGIPHSQVSPNIGVSPSNSSPGKPETAMIKTSNQNILKETETRILEHGEDKIIMHLRKDRIKPKKYCISIQTETLPHFTPLQKLEKIKSKHIDERNNSHSHSQRVRNASYSSNDDENHRRYSRSRNYRSNHNRSISPVSQRRNNSTARNSYTDRRGYRESNRSYSPNHRRTRSPRSRRSHSNSKDRNHIKHPRPTSRCSSKSLSSNSSNHSRYQPRNRSRRYSTSSSSSRSSMSRSRSRGSSHRRSRSRSKIKERQLSPGTEERRIVYVGRIERETTKDDLKSKFLQYGPIKQITFHHKDTGMKYGFVTYERGQDALKAIDSGGRDPAISMYDISFGGRRAFCRNFYSDLDGISSISDSGMLGPSSNTTTNSHLNKNNSHKADDSFEALLQKVKDKISAKKPITKI